MVSRNISIATGVAAGPRARSCDSCKSSELIWKEYQYVVCGLRWRSFSPLPNFEIVQLLFWSCRLIISDKVEPKMYIKCYKLRQLLGSTQNPDEELMTLPILLVFTQLAIVVSSLSCLQLPHSDVRVGFLVCSPWLHGRQEEFLQEWAKFKFVGTWTSEDVEKTTKTFDDLKFLKPSRLLWLVWMRFLKNHSHSLLQARGAQLIWAVSKLLIVQ